jgi:hypothetical protein
MNRYLGAVVLSVAMPLAAGAQASPTPDSLRSSIVATVSDSLGFPVTGASVMITPGGLILRTDSAGRFVARDIAPGPVTILIRRLGFSPLQSRVNLHVGIELALDLVMPRLPQLLAEVEIKAGGQCPRYALEGILCRTAQGHGYLMNRQDVLAKSKDVYHPMLILRDAPGFRQNLNGNPTTVESIVGWRCWRRLVDGGFPGSGRAIRRPQDIYAVEIYQPPDIPAEYQHAYWGNDLRRKMSQPCTLVVIWSMAEAQRQLKRLSVAK